MKNGSWKYPFPTFADKMFDGNKDGKLDAFETAFRDAHIEEMNRNVAKEEHQQKRTFITEWNPQKEKDVNTTSSGVQLFFTLIAIAVLVGGFILALSTEGTTLIKAIILFGAVDIAIGLLKFVGLYK